MLNTEDAQTADILITVRTRIHVVPALKIQSKARVIMIITGRRTTMHVPLTNEIKYCPFCNYNWLKRNEQQAYCECPVCKNTFRVFADVTNQAFKFQNEKYGDGKGEW